MKKKLNGKLALSKETLRTLDYRRLDGVQGGISRFCETGSEVTGTCNTCLGPSCDRSCPSDLCPSYDTTC